MKKCFCGCGRTIPRFPLGARSINKRGLLVSEWLAWAEAVLAGDQSLDPGQVPSMEPWLEGGHRIADDLRAAMHGEISPASLDESEVREWQQIAWSLNPLVAAAGRPSINDWLDQPGSREKVRLVAAGGSTLPERARATPPSTPPAPELDAQSWREMASLVATDAFEPPAELTLQRATKQQLGLEFFDSLADSQLTHLSTARLGYAMRNWECQAVRNAEREAPGDQFFRLVDERGQSDDYPHPGLDRWLIDLFLEITDDSRKSGEVLGEMPGATASLRYEAIELMAADYPEIDKTEWTRLLLCGYLLHRAAEARPILG